MIKSSIMSILKWEVLHRLLSGQTHSMWNQGRVRQVVQVITAIFFLILRRDYINGNLN